MMRAAFLLLSVACCAGACHEKPFFEDAGPLVSTDDGKLVGKYVKVFDTDVAAFLGVPFAEPPVGDLSFRTPEPVRPWKGLLLAHDKPPPCMQYSARHYAWVPTTEPTEDCLYLNVWAPARPRDQSAGGMPVLVWIHGGAFTTGSTDMDIYDGSVMASYGDAVVVSVNYRLGMFGFLNAGTDSAPGNAGMHDQVLAMKWVRDNIRHFGGDPDRVTLFGESAGSMSISMHLVSPLSKGLFQRAIMQSGTMYNPAVFDTPQVAQRKVAEFAQLADCEGESAEDIVACFKSKDAGELSKLENTVTDRNMMFFLPSSGNAFLPKTPIDAYESGDIQQVDVLIGSVRDEGSLFLPIMAPEVFRFDQQPQLSLQQADSITRTLFRLIPKPAVDGIVAYYFQNSNATEDGQPPNLPKIVAEAFGDAFFNCPTVFLAEKLSNARMYWMTHHSNKELEGWLGVHHFSDVPYVFGGPIVDSARYSPEDGKFSGDLIQMWVNFARNGHPLSDESSWPRFSKDDPVTMELNPRTSGLVTFPRYEVCDALWRHMYVPPKQESIEVF